MAIFVLLGKVYAGMSVRPQPNDNRQIITRLVHSLQMWKNGAGPEKFAFALEHKYSQVLSPISLSLPSFPFLPPNALFSSPSPPLLLFLPSPLLLIPLSSTSNPHLISFSLPQPSLLAHFFIFHSPPFLLTFSHTGIGWLKCHDS